MGLGNSAPSLLFSYKVNFTREIPNDFYLSGDRVQGIIQIATNDNENDLIQKYGPLYVELIGELHDFKTDTHQHYTKGVQIFFRTRTQIIQLPNDNQKLGTNHLRNYRWAFDGSLDSLLPSSLPPGDECDPCICYYALVYLRRADNNDFARKFPFLVFTRASNPIFTRQSLQNNIVDARVRHKGVTVYGTLSNNGLVVPGQTLILQIEIDNPMKVTMKLIRATLKQYRHITDQDTDFTVFSFILPGFKPKGFNSEYRQSTYELPIPMEKCRLMPPTSSYKSVRYELDIQCHLNCSFNNQFTLTLPIICTTDHQQPLKILDELKSVPEILRRLTIRKEKKQPPSYEDFMASEILPKQRNGNSNNLTRATTSVLTSQLTVIKPHRRPNPPTNISKATRRSSLPSRSIVGFDQLTDSLERLEHASPIFIRAETRPILNSLFQCLDDCNDFLETLQYSDRSYENEPENFAELSKRLSQLGQDLCLALNIQELFEQKQDREDQRQDPQE
ncbi:unnamed protein product [Rotaria socialis]|uniref:Arrestin C-terminal-like domain-containing protein n=1 Tax=Rotaria socialis TaxID=392032 RepID=A0A820M3T0_9BILA|nr:unnamed protein product [Rotaria socialis]CAF4367279.1 unnamed protein product [Rotaria socialis]